MTSQGPHVLVGDEQFDDGQGGPGFSLNASELDILPMSTGVPILPRQSAQITWHRRITDRPQTRIYKIGCFVISSAGTAGGSADWIVNDIKINGASQFVQYGDVSGVVFATNTTNEIDKFVRFAPVQVGDSVVVVVVVTYIGLNEMGCPFFGSMVGTVVDTAAAEI
jgi:hypothetical protein